MATTQQEIKSLKNDIDDIKSSLRNIAKEESNGLAKVITFEQERLKDAAKNAGVSAREFVADKREKIADAGEQLQGKVRKRPLTSAAIAFASGALIVAILKRK